MTFRFLGTGTSVGVPQIGCTCRVCTSGDPRDRRRRCGAYVTAGKTAFLIDTPPEMREACLAYGIRKVDAIVLTHAHMDHVAGFDDVRRFNTINGHCVECRPTDPGANGRTFRVEGKPLTCYAMEETVAQMHRIFPYVGLKGGENGLFRPQIAFSTDPVFTLGSVRIERLAVEHGFPCCGYLLTDASPSSEPRTLAYVSDCHVLPEATLAKMKGVDTLVLNCLREREHPTHLRLQDALAYVERIAPRRAFFIHMCHDLSHRDYLARLRGTCAKPAYDGLRIRI